MSPTNQPQVEMIPEVTARPIPIMKSVLVDRASAAKSSMSSQSREMNIVNVDLESPAING